MKATALAEGANNKEIPQIFLEMLKSVSRMMFTFAS